MAPSSLNFTLCKQLKSRLTSSSLSAMFLGESLSAETACRPERTAATAIERRMVRMRWPPTWSEEWAQLGFLYSAFAHQGRPSFNSHDGYLPRPIHIRDWRIDHDSGRWLK